MQADDSFESVSSEVNAELNSHTVPTQIEVRVRARSTSCGQSTLPASLADWLSSLTPAASPLIDVNNPFRDSLAMRRVPPSNHRSITLYLRRLCVCGCTQLSTSSIKRQLGPQDGHTCQGTRTPRDPSRSAAGSALYGSQTRHEPWAIRGGRPLPSPRIP